MLPASDLLCRSLPDPCTHDTGPSSVNLRPISRTALRTKPETQHGRHNKPCPLRLGVPGTRPRGSRASLVTIYLFRTTIVDRPSALLCAHLLKKDKTRNSIQLKLNAHNLQFTASYDRGCPRLFSLHHSQMTRCSTSSSSMSSETERRMLPPVYVHIHVQLYVEFVVRSILRRSVRRVFDGVTGAYLPNLPGTQKPEGCATLFLIPFSVHWSPKLPGQIAHLRN